MSVFLAVVVSFVAALVAVRAVERHAPRVGLIDLPNDRSSHVVPRPRGGGLGLLCGVATGALVVAAAGISISGAVWVVLGASLLVALTGLWDDVSSIGVMPRLIAQIAAAAIVVCNLGGVTAVPLPAPFNASLGDAGVVVAIVWMVGVTNFFNFMDGADGLAGGQAAVTLIALGALSTPAAGAIPLVVAASVLGFLVRNWAPAHIFLGDVGSGWLGFVLAALPFAGPGDARGPLILLVATSMALFLVDPLLTLVRRFSRGAPLMASHREHAYQQLFDPTQSHSRVVAALLGAATILTAVAIAAFHRPGLAWWSIALAVFVCLVEWRLAAARQRNRVQP